MKLVRVVHWNLLRIEISFGTVTPTGREELRLPFSLMSLTIYSRAIRFLSVAALFIMTSLSHAQDAKTLESLLQATYKDKIVTLKRFCVDKEVHYVSNGIPKKNCEVGPWTLYSRLRISQVKVSDSTLRVEGRRVGVGFQGQKTILFNTSDPIHVEIDLDKPPDSASIKHALGVILLTPSDRLEDYVPYYWKQFFRKDKKWDSIPGRVDDPPGPITQLRASAAAQASKLIKQPKPAYPMFAKLRSVQGSVTMMVIIGRNGRIMNLSVTDPAGLGLDEEALEAVKDWEYKPTILKGEPVEVETQIIVNFNLAGGAEVTLGNRPKTNPIK